MVNVYTCMEWLHKECMGYTCKECCRCHGNCLIDKLLLWNKVSLSIEGSLHELHVLDTTTSAVNR